MVTELRIDLLIGQVLNHLTRVIAREACMPVTVKTDIQRRVG